MKRLLIVLFLFCINNLISFANDNILSTDEYIQMLNNINIQHLQNKIVFFVNEGNTYFKQKNYPRAIFNYNEALKLNPSLGYIYYNRGNAYYNLHQYSLAISNYVTAITYGYKNENVYFMKGLSEYYCNNFYSAIADFNYVLKYNQKRDEAYALRGICKLNIYEYNEAINDFKLAIAINPNNNLAKNNINNINMQLKHNSRLTSNKKISKPTKNIIQTSNTTKENKNIAINKNLNIQAQKNNIKNNKTTNVKKQSNTNSRNNNESLNPWLFFWIFYGLIGFIINCNINQKINERKKYETIHKMNIEKNLKESTIYFDKNGKPIAPNFSEYSLDFNTYKFIRDYEKLSDKEKYKIELPNDYFEYNNGLYKRYITYYKAFCLYNSEIEKYALKQEQLLRQKRSYWQKRWQDICKEPYEFENAVGDLYRKLGYKVNLTKGSGDGGVDLILKRDKETIVVQCKAHKNPVGPAPVRELWGVKDDFKATSAIFIAYAGVTSGAYDFARNKKLEIIDVNKLIEMSIEVEKRQQKNKK